MSLCTGNPGPDRYPGQRRVLCPFLGREHNDSTVSLADVVDDAGNSPPKRWSDWIAENVSLGVQRSVILAILAENRLRPRAAVALYGPQPSEAE